MIATDIDGTMLRSDGSLSPRVKAALRAAVEAGIHVVPATGRPVVIAADVIDQAELEDYWVFANGAITRHVGRDELVRGFWLDPTVAAELLGFLRTRLPQAGFAIEFEDTVAFEAGFEQIVPIVPDQAPVDDLLSEFFSFDPEIGPPAGHRVQKILVYDLNLNVEELFAQVSDVVGARAVPSFSGLAFVELAAELVTKAMALEQLAGDLGVSPAEVASFGDNHNDVSMLAWAGRGYAMANATRDAMAAADEVIGANDDDGLAVKIEELIDQVS